MTANVLTWYNDNARTGQNLSKKVLTPSNVNSTNFGNLFSINVDGKVDAQTLFVSRNRAAKSRRALQPVNSVATSVALWPPKPKELVSATRTLFSHATFGV